MELTPYLFFNGNCLEAMTHYADILGGRVVGVFRNGDAPDPADRMPGGENLVMNMAIDFGGRQIMASDAPAPMYRQPQGLSVSIELKSADEFNRIHAGLSQGALSVAMEPAETFWAERFAMFTDRYGTPWMLGFTGAKRPS